MGQGTNTLLAGPVAQGEAKIMDSTDSSKNPSKEADASEIPSWCMSLVWIWWQVETLVKTTLASFL